MNSQTQTSDLPWENSLRYDVFVIGLFMLMLVVGWSLKSSVEGRTNIFTDPDFNLSLSYPESWATMKEKGTLLSIQDMQSEGPFKTRFSVRVKEFEQLGIKSAHDMVSSLTDEKAHKLMSYRILETNDSQVDRQDAVRISYAYVEDPPDNTLQSYLPVVVKGVDVMVIHGANLYIFTFAAPATVFSQETETLETILRSVDLKQED